MSRTKPYRPEKIVSGGQTGADRGALDAAIALEIPHGGYCPRGRRAEDGRIPDRYKLIETASGEYPQRTRANVAMADAIGWAPLERVNILDVYAVGKLPQVQLVHAKSVGLPHVGWAWRPGEMRTDINEDLLEAIVARLAGAL